MALRTIFLDRHGDVRVAWRLLLFLLLLGVCGAVVMIPAQQAAADNTLLLRLLSLAAILLATWVMTRGVNRKPLRAIGLAMHPRMHVELGIGALLGFAMIAGLFAVEALLGYVRLVPRALSLLQIVHTLGSGLVLFLLAAAAEELLFRGYLYQTLIQGVTLLPATLIMAALFGVAHISNPGATAFSTLNVALAGVWLSVAYVKTRSLWLPIVLHASWNWCESVLFSFPVSGWQRHENTLFTLVQGGPTWVTGGDFGPEGGILATLALIAGTWYLLKTPALQAPEGVITLDSVEDLLPARKQGTEVATGRSAPEAPGPRGRGPNGTGGEARE